MIDIATLYELLVVFFFIFGVLMLMLAVFSQEYVKKLSVGFLMLFVIAALCAFFYKYGLTEGLWSGSTKLDV